MGALGKAHLCRVSEKDTRQTASRAPHTPAHDRYGGVAFTAVIVCQVPFVRSPVPFTLLLPSAYRQMKRRVCFAVSYTRQSCCRVFSGLCRVCVALGKVAESGSASSSFPKKYRMTVLSINHFFLFLLKDLSINHFRPATVVGACLYDINSSVHLRSAQKSKKGVSINR